MEKFRIWGVTQHYSLYQPTKDWRAYPIPFSNMSSGLRFSTCNLFHFMVMFIQFLRTIHPQAMTLSRADPPDTNAAAWTRPDLMEIKRAWDALERDFFPNLICRWNCRIGQRMALPLCTRYYYATTDSTLSTAAPWVPLAHSLHPVWTKHGSIDPTQPPRLPWSWESILAVGSGTLPFLNPRPRSSFRPTQPWYP